MQIQMFLFLHRDLYSRHFKWSTSNNKQHWTNKNVLLTCSHCLYGFWICKSAVSNVAVRGKSCHLEKFLRRFLYQQANKLWQCRPRTWLAEHFITADIRRWRGLVTKVKLPHISWLQNNFIKFGLLCSLSKPERAWKVKVNVTHTEALT